MAFLKPATNNEPLSEDLLPEEGAAPFFIQNPERARKQKEQEEKQQKEEERRFSQLLASVYGCGVQDCSFTIPGLCDNGLDWLEKFEGTQTPLGLHARLAAGNRAVGDIALKNDGVYFNLEKSGDIQTQIFGAFAMTALALAHPGIRKNGAQIGGSDTEKALLYIATKMAGIKISAKQEADIAPRAQQIAASLQAQGIDITALWRDFCKDMNINIPAAPEDKAKAEPASVKAVPETTPPPPPPAEEKSPAKTDGDSLKDTVKDILAKNAVDEDLYKRAKEKILRDFTDKGAHPTNKKLIRDFEITAKGDKTPHTRARAILAGMEQEKLLSRKNGRSKVLSPG